MQVIKTLWLSFFLIILSLNVKGQGNMDNINTLILNRDYYQANILCDQILNEDQENYDAWFNKGLALQGMQDYIKAISSFQNAGVSEQLSKTSKYRLAECYELAGDRVSAIEIFDSLFQIDSTDFYSIQKLGSLYLRDRDYIMSKKHYKTLTDSFPNNYLFNKNLGICYYNLNEEVNATKHFANAWLYNKKDMSLPVSIANAYSRLKMPDNALSWLKDGLAQDSSNIPILKTAGFIKYSLANYEEASEYFEKAFNYGDTGVFVNKYLGLSYFSLSDWAQSIPYLRAYYNSDTLNTEASYYLGIALSNWYYKDEGVFLLQRTIDLSYPDPKFIASIYAGIAISHADLNRRDIAIEKYKKALSLDPINASYMIEIAKLYDDLGRMNDDTDSYKEALKYYEDFLKITEARLIIIMKERNLDIDQISSPGLDFSKKRKTEIREELFFKGVLKE